MVTSLSVSQAHLLSLFDNVNRVVFNEKIYDQIVSFQSQEGETVGLSQAVLAQVQVTENSYFPRSIQDGCVYIVSVMFPAGFQG